jgi:hypothetical protein
MIEWGKNLAAESRMEAWRLPNPADSDCAHPREAFYAVLNDEDIRALVAADVDPSKNARAVSRNDRENPAFFSGDAWVEARVKTPDGERAVHLSKIGKTRSNAHTANIVLTAYMGEIPSELTQEEREKAEIVIWAKGMYGLETEIRMGHANFSKTQRPVMQNFYAD